MVDYTKKELRDESWHRWKGGAKLATELKNFYTAKHVFERLGQQVPLTAGSPGAAKWDGPRYVQGKRMSPMERLRHRNWLRRAERGFPEGTAMARVMERLKQAKEGA